jgi:hypothetical protein
VGYDQEMALTVDQLAEEAMRLPVELRAELADRLVASLELTAPDDLLKLWTSEAIRRRDEIRSGHIQPIPEGR